MNWLLFFLAVNLGPAQSMTLAPGEDLNLEISGQGPPVVLLPGLSGGAYGYRQVIPRLVAEGFQTIIIEPLGFGWSAKPQDADYCLSAQAHRISAVMDSLGLHEAVVVGHGVSTSICLRLAMNRPDLVGTLVSVEGGAQDSAATDTVEKSLNMVSLVARLGATRVLRDRFRDNLKAASGDKSWVTKHNVRKYFAPVARDISSSIAVLRLMARAEDPTPLRDHLHRISCPVVMLLGDAPHEGGLTVPELDFLETALPDLEVNRVPGAGHFIFEEQPEVLVQAIVALTREDVRTIPHPSPSDLARKTTTPRNEVQSCGR